MEFLKLYLVLQGYWIGEVFRDFLLNNWPKLQSQIFETLNDWLLPPTLQEIFYQYFHFLEWPIHLAKGSDSFRETIKVYIDFGVCFEI